MILGVTGEYPIQVEEDLSGLNILHNIAFRLIEAMSPEVVLTSMTRGFPQACASACISQGRPFIAYLPYDKQEAPWSEAEQAIYAYLLERASGTEYVSMGGLVPWKRVRCARKVVDDCDHMLVLYSGGKLERLRLAIDYAQSINRKIENCWPIWARFLAKKREMVARQVSEIEARVKQSRYEDSPDDVRDWERII